MAYKKRTTPFRFWLWLIALVGVIVPRRLRADWRQEWEAELRHREALLEEWDRLDWRSKLDLMRRSLGAFWDAVLLQPRRLEDEMFQDLRYGIRMLMKNPGYTVVSALTLALCIGANTAIFSAVNGVLLDPLPYKEPDQLAMLWTDLPRQDVHEGRSSYANIEDWKSQSRAFEDIAVFDPVSSTVTGASEPEQVQTVRASANLFPLLGVAPLLGRTYSSDEELNRDRVVILSHSLWQRQFGGSPDVIGRTVEIDGVASQIIGVMPAYFKFPSENTQLWEPHTLFADWDELKMRRGTDSWLVAGRLKPDAALKSAQTEMNAIASRLEQQFPESNAGLGINVVSLHAQVTGRDVRLALWILFGAVAFVLLIACANLAGLTLARGAARQREFAIRMAMGAGRARLIRQMLTESAALSLSAGLLGILFAETFIRALIAFGPQDIPRLNEIGIDGGALAFTAGVSLVAGMLFGLVPALKVSRTNPIESLKDGGRNTAGKGGRRAGNLLVVAELSLAVVLLAGAGLLIRSFLAIQNVDPGFRPDNVLIVQTLLARSANDAQRRAFGEQAIERIKSLPGVVAAGAIEDVFISGNPDGLLTIEGRAGETPGPSLEQFGRDSISPDYFRAMGVPLIGGRFFTHQDGPDSPRVALINETMARRFWPEANAVGKRFRLGDRDADNSWITVVGIVGDMRRQGLDRQPIPQMFESLSQNTSHNLNIVVRAESEPQNLVAAVRGEIWAINKTVPVYQISTLERKMGESVTQRRFQTGLLSLFSAFALLLAAIGVYGLMRQSVSLRTHEIGIRMALGAQRGDVLRLVIWQGMKLALAGIAIGVMAALELTQLMASLLFGVTPTDPATFAGVGLTLAAVALAACYIPARKASKVDPMIALRCE